MLHYRYTNCVKGFNLPLSLNSKDAKIKIFPTDKWKELKLTVSQAELFTVDGIEKMYYVNPVIVEK